jgi:hypothetical protein
MHFKQAELESKRDKEIIELEFENKLLGEKKQFETLKFETHEDLVNFLKMSNSSLKEEM